MEPGRDDREEEEHELARHHSEVDAAMEPGRDDREEGGLSEIERLGNRRYGARS